MICLDILIECRHFLLKKKKYLPKKITESKIIIKKCTKLQSNTVMFHRCLGPQQSSYKLQDQLSRVKARVFGSGGIVELF